MQEPNTPIKANRKTTPLDKYAGGWVAFAEGKVVALGFVSALSPGLRQIVAQLCGAGDRIRTGDSLLGRQELYR